MTLPQSRVPRHLTVSDSSNIESVGYNLATQTLEVRFLTGGVYAYPAVSPREFAALVSAPSIGHHFRVHFRDTNHPFEKLS